MSEQVSEKARTLDWRDLAPEPDWHSCDCDYCEMVGEREPTAWPMLVTAEGDGQEYVTDRFLMIRADLAPIPDAYEGPLPTQRPKAADLLGSLAQITEGPPPPEQHFRWSVLKALDLTGWELRAISDSEKRVGVVDQSGKPIGVSIAASRVNDDERSPDFTLPYGQRGRVAQ